MARRPLKVCAVVRSMGFLSLLYNEPFAKIDERFEEHLQFCNRRGQMDESFKFFCDTFECAEVVWVGGSYNVAEQDKERCQGVIEYSPSEGKLVGVMTQCGLAVCIPMHVCNM